MNTVRFKTWIAVAAITLATATVAFSQSGSTAPMGHRGRWGFGFGMMADYLDLTDAQRTQVKQIIAAEKPTLFPLVQQVIQSKQQMLQEVSSGTFDQAKVTTLATQQAQIQTQLTVEKAKIMSEIFNILTPDQKTKAVSFLQKHAARIEQHLQNAQPPTAQQ
jgi:periplasmic protein CpxP/Spy